MTAIPKNLFIAGSPGVGKTSLIKETTFPFREQLGGFYTEQVMESGQRMGFKIIAFSGRSALLASKSMASSVRLNKYGIDLKALEEVGVREIEAAVSRRRLVVIDEIGAMEALCERFRTAAMAALQSQVPVLASVRSGTHDFSDMVKRLSDSRLIELDRRNYLTVKKEVDEWLRCQTSTFDTFPKQ